MTTQDPELPINWPLLLSDSNQNWKKSRNSPLLMEPEGSLPCLQEPAIGPYLQLEVIFIYINEIFTTPMKNINFNVVYSFLV
jgi:hypothetical protein